MAVKTLAVMYRPMSFADVVEQGSVKAILSQQLKSKEVKNAYLFCGGAGTGKTTCARIFANEINNHQGNPIEMDAASNSSVDDVREIIQQAKTKSLDSEYKVFIIDEAHSLSNTAWQAFLKVLEEPPMKSIFIFATTDPQKIPKTILSRVQRYDFQRISHEGIKRRLVQIIQTERCNGNDFYIEPDACDYIAKLADGGMRDAITLMDKCLAFNRRLTVESVVKALGTVDYSTMISLASDIVVGHNVERTVKTIEDVHRAGKDLKQFIKTFTNFMLDVCKYGVMQSCEYIDIPNIHEEDISYISGHNEECQSLLTTLIKLNADIKWETSPKSVIEAVLMLECMKEYK